MVLVAAVFLALFSFATSYQLLQLYSFNPSQQQELVQAHNQLRRAEWASNMQEMVWDEGLATLARDHVATCNAWHRDASTRVGYGYNYIGENIWWSTERTLRGTLGGIIRDFYNERPYYHFNSLTCQWGQQCGHYTQVVWYRSCAVGCAAAYCDGIQYGAGINHGHIYICNYGPGGNSNYEYPFNVGPACSQCPGACHNGLCAPQCVGRRHPLHRWALDDGSHTNQLPQAVEPVNTFTRQHASSADPNVCTNNNNNCDYWQSIGECDNNYPYMGSNCRLACNLCNTGTNQGTGCTNSDSSCDYWQSIGECQNNYAFMSQNCRLACNFCGAETTGGNTVTGNEIKSACVDEDLQCGYWARINECNRNPPYMDWKCRKACGKC